MLLPEDGLDRLLEQLGALTAADRKAILARLRPAERRRIRAHLGQLSGAPAKPVSPYSPDIAARIAAADKVLTPAGRKALDAFLFPLNKQAAKPQARGAPLAQAMGGLLRPRGQPL